VLALAVDSATRPARSAPSELTIDSPAHISGHRPVDVRGSRSRLA
jgi:hypothetical protein